MTGAVLLLLLAACGDDGGETLIGGAAGPVTSVVGPEDEMEPGPEMADTEGPAVLIEEATIDVGAGIYYEGFLVEFGEARIVIGEETDDDFDDGFDDDFDTSFDDGPGAGDTAGEPVAAVEVDATVENLRDSDMRFSSDEIELEWEGGTAPASSHGEADSGSVRPGASAGITLHYPVDGTFSFDTATLYAGTPAVLQPVVPLGDPSATESMAPIELEIPDDSRGSSEVLEAEITGLTLYPFNRWGVIGEQRPVDEPLLEVTLDVTRLDAGGYGANVMVQDQRLQLPDGTQIAPPGGSAGGGLNDILEGGSTIPDAVLVFELSDVPFDPAELTGGEEFTLIATGTSVSWDGMPEAHIPFELRAKS